MVPNPSFRVCVAANSDITITSPGGILFATPRRRPGARICAASAMASRPTVWWDWRCGAVRRLTSAQNSVQNPTPNNSQNHRRRWPRKVP
jgi:hypothetical protein